MSRLGEINLHPEMIGLAIMEEVRQATTYWGTKHDDDQSLDVWVAKLDDPLDQIAVLPHDTPADIAALIAVFGKIATIAECAAVSLARIHYNDTREVQDEE